VNLRQQRTGIDLCLSNGKRIYDDAEILFKLDRYHTSIPLYILAYEEFCKGLYLGMNYMKGKEVNDSEFRKLTKSRTAHTEKIMIDALAFSRMLESETDERIAARRRFADQTGSPFTKLDKQRAIDLNRQFTKMFERLHNLKMAMLYADYNNNAWSSPKRFNENKLREVCEYLRHEVIRVFYEIRTNLFYHANVISADSANLSEEQIRLIRENADFQERMKLDQIYRTPLFHRYLRTVLSITNSV
jgi:AbiV family abortive infection protein